MPKMTRQDVARDENNNISSQNAFKGDLEENGKAVYNAKFYDSNSEDEISTNSKMSEDKSESSAGEEQSDCVETRGKNSKELCKDGADDKPTQSYIALIAMAILSSPKRRMVLSDIYQYILDNYPFYKTKDKSWRNSIRHNLSLNECFVKAGRSENGKGNYWAIHPSNIEDFTKGDYRRRRARRKTKRSIHSSGLYSECFQPYTILSPIFGLNRKTLPCYWGAYDIRHSNCQTNSESLPRQTPRKSFTIDSILGIENETKAHSHGTIADVGTRRHHSAPTYNYQRCPSYEGSAFAPFDRSNNTFDHYLSQHKIPLEYHLAPEYLQYTMFNARNSVQELKRSRPSFL